MEDYDREFAQEVGRRIARMTPAEREAYAPRQPEMSELAKRLLPIIQRGPILFMDLWCAIPYENSFDEMQTALAELIDTGKIERIGDAFAFCAADAA